MFNIFASGTTAYANEVMENFYHIGQGSRFPMGGSELANTDSVYDIGSSSTTWANIYVNNVNCTNIAISGSVTSDLMPYIKYEYAIDSNNTATSSIEFTGLNGDTEKEYFIQIDSIINTSTADVNLIFNGDSSESYCFQRISQRLTYTSIPIVKNIISTEILTVANLNIIAKSGNVRMILIDISTLQAALNPFTGAVWSNTYDEITSIKFFDKSGNLFLTGSSIKLWVMPS